MDVNLFNQFKKIKFKVYEVETKITMPACIVQNILGRVVLTLPSMTNYLKPNDWSQLNSKERGFKMDFLFMFHGYFYFILTVDISVMYM